jgi:hypothetical protein
LKARDVSKNGSVFIFRWKGEREIHTDGPFLVPQENGERIILRNDMGFLA